jgi:hypothetical protein
VIDAVIAFFLLGGLADLFKAAMARPGPKLPRARARYRERSDG